MFRGSDLDFTFPGCGILAFCVIIAKHSKSFTTSSHTYTGPHEQLT